MCCDHFELDDESDDEETLELSQDIYSLTFHQFQKSPNSLWHRELMIKAVMTWIMQLALCALVLANIFDPEEGLGNVTTGNVYLNSGRLLCSILLHIQIMPEIRVSIEMMRYAVSNPNSFQRKGNFKFAFTLAAMKLMGAIFTELINMFKMG